MRWHDDAPSDAANRSEGPRTDSLRKAVCHQADAARRRSFEQPLYVLLERPESMDRKPARLALAPLAALAALILALALPAGAAAKKPSAKAKGVVAQATVLQL